MSGAGIAGLLRERVAVWRGDGARDALGGVSGVGAAVARAWAGCVPDGPGRWRIAVRPCDVRVGDVVVRAAAAGAATRLRVVRVLADPRLPDRITLYAEETP